MLGFSASGVTEMVSLARVGLSFSTEVVGMGKISCCVESSCRALRPVGATGFEPATSRSQSGRSSQAELRPESLTQLVSPFAAARRTRRITDGPTKVYCTARTRPGRATHAAHRVECGGCGNPPRLPGAVPECAHDRPDAIRAVLLPAEALAQRSRTSRRHHALPRLLLPARRNDVRRMRTPARRARGVRPAGRVDTGVRRRAGPPAAD